MMQASDGEAGIGRRRIRREIHSHEPLREGSQAMEMKKWATSSVIVALAAITAVGCSSSKSADKPAASPSAAASVKPSASAAPTEKKVEKVYVYANGGNLTGATDSSKPESVEKVRKAIIDKIGIDVQAIIPPKGSEADKLNIMLASNEPLDIFMGSMSLHQSKGAVMPLNDLLDKFGQNSKKLWPAEWKGGWEALTTKDGKIWGLPINAPSAGSAVLLREDWLKKLNLKQPTSIDELETILKAFKDSDPAGGGKTIPLLTNYSELNNSLAAGFMDVGYGNWVDTDGKVKPPVLNPGYKDFVAKVADWYKKGYIYKETFAIDIATQIDLVKQNRVAAAAHWHSRELGNQFALQATNPDAKYVVADQLRGPKGLTMTMGGAQGNGWMISKNSKNPEAAMKYLNWLQSDLENYMLAFFGIEGENWKWVDKANKVYEKLNRDYLGDLIAGMTFAYTVQFRDSAPAGAPAFDYYKNFLTNPKTSKKIALADYEFKFDTKKLSDNIPTLGDLNRMIEQETIKFIMGARPIGEWDAFLQELNKAGMDKWIAAYTAEYNAVK